MGSRTSNAFRALVGVGVALGIATAPLTSAYAQQLSDRSVQVLMDYAWTILPAKFTTRTNKVITIDKSKKAEIMVPRDVGRAIIEVARLSAFAQICNLPNAQSANYRAMMRVEQKKKTWTDAQLLYISQLHLFTILWLTGNVEVSADGGEKNIELKEGDKAKKPTCTDTERENVKKRIVAYVKSTGGKVQ